MIDTTPPIEEIAYFFNGNAAKGFAGQNVAAAILANGERILRSTRVKNKPRGIFCGIGICFDCLLVIDGVPNQRGCLVEIREGMRIESQGGSDSYATAENR